MAVPTRSSSERNRRAWQAVFIGLLSVASMPGAVVITHFAEVDLLWAGLAIPAGLLLGVVAVRRAREARHLTQRTIGRIRGVRVAGSGVLLGSLGIYLALAATVAIGVYELLSRLSG